MAISGWPSTLPREESVLDLDADQRNGLADDVRSEPVMRRILRETGLPFAVGKADGFRGPRVDNAPAQQDQGGKGEAFQYALHSYAFLAKPPSAVPDTSIPAWRTFRPGRRR